MGRSVPERGDGAVLQALTEYVDALDAVGAASANNAAKLISFETAEKVQHFSATVQWALNTKNGKRRAAAPLSDLAEHCVQRARALSRAGRQAHANPSVNARPPMRVAAVRLRWP